MSSGPRPGQDTPSPGAADLSQDPARPSLHSLDPYPLESLSVDARRAARQLLGAVLVTRVHGSVTAGRIVETEAYFGPADPASHAADRIGRTRRNEPMFGRAGTIYVYRIYGVHRCFNVVTDAPGYPSAVLIRALEPWTGLDAMAARRGRAVDLCSGPGRLAAALALTEELNGRRMDGPDVSLLRAPPVAATEVVVTGRVGISRAQEWPLRFAVKGAEDVSRASVASAERSTDYLAALRRHRAARASALAQDKSGSHSP